MDAAAAEPTLIEVHRYANGKVLAREENFNVNIRKKYGAPFTDMHRVDLQRILYDRAIELGVQVKLDSRVSTIEHSSERPQVNLESGANYTCDLLVGADGLWSRCRESLHASNDKPLPTGDLAYRIVLTLDQMQDPELRAWVSNPQVHFWVGPYAHAVAYSLRSGTMFNIVLLCPDNLPEAVARQKGDVGEMKALFKDWDPILTRFLDQVDTVDKWKLMHRAELDSWANERANFVLLGDSCHPMLPYLAQGANSSIEDGGVLGRLMSYVKTKEQLPQAVRRFVELRQKRGESVVRETFHQVNSTQSIEYGTAFGKQE